MLAVSASLAYKKHAQKEDGSGLPHGPRRPPSRGRLTAAHSVERTHRTPPHAYAARRAGALLAGRGARAGAQAARVPGERAARRGAGGQARLQPRRQRAHTAAGRKLAQQAVGVRAGRARDRAVQPRDLCPRRSSFGRVKATMYSWQTYRPLCRSVRSALAPTRLSGWTRYQAALGRHRQHCLVLRISHPCPPGNLVRLQGKQEFTIYCCKATPAPGWGWPARLRWLRWQAPAPAQAAPARAAAHARPYLNTSCVAIVESDD